MIEINKIYNMDCLDGMKLIDNESIDLVITDPPWGVRKKEEWDNFENFIKNIDLWLYECLRISKNGVIWFCAGDKIPYILQNQKEIFHRLLFWNKLPGCQYAGSALNNIWYSTDPILIFKKNNLNKKGKESEYSYSYFQARPHKFDDFKHPTVKPISLIKWLIRHYSDKNDIILDPFIGSGTTAIAALETNRNFIGFELNKEYFDIANNRIKDWQTQMRF